MRIFGRGIWGKPDASQRDAARHRAGRSRKPAPRASRRAGRARSCCSSEAGAFWFRRSSSSASSFASPGPASGWRRRIGRGPPASAFSRLPLALACLPLRNFHSPSRREALERIDRVSGLSQRPAAVLDDRLGNARRGRGDARLSGACTGAAPKGLSPCFAPACLPPARSTSIATPCAPRCSSASSPRASSPGRRNMRASPRLSTGASAASARPASASTPGSIRLPIPAVRRSSSTRHGAAAQRIEAPSGSIVVIRGSAGKPGFEASGALAQAAQDAAASAPNAPAQAAPARAAPPATKATRAGETRLVLKGDAKLTIEFRRRIRIYGDPGRCPDDRPDRSAEAPTRGARLR